ncbi:DEAD/DEAH box helicase [Paenibacillus albicereus]|uniref:DEAD/DEAH box helicase n=1 Tax=Paenibacillus albicereus TaxID=2726185 RepID=A0A6H2H2P2_9BACL|nr:DEAD/DEAH box helicase [Paenibacillus albicereus]QJC53905.1 DEAD/DEAH box helicase [Paenibacillus albicereus]
MSEGGDGAATEAMPAGDSMRSVAFAGEGDAGSTRGQAEARTPNHARSENVLDPALKPFHPVLAEWFEGTFGTPTDAQRRAWSSILGGAHTLLAAPTGSGKTLAALLPCLDRVLRAKEAAFAPEARAEDSATAAGPEQAASPSSDGRARGDEPESAAAPEPALEGGSSGAVWRPGVRVLYVTPLKALNNDIYDHVTEFVAQIAERMERRSHQGVPGITCAVRTGDTPSSKRAAMLRRPPDVLVTTPESLFILLGSDKGRLMLRTAEQIIVDEIHDLAADKRGSHLSLTLERLEAWRGGPLQRIGLSATQKPMERVARFLGGWAPPDSADAPRPVARFLGGWAPPDSADAPRPVARFLGGWAPPDSADAPRPVARFLGGWAPPDSVDAPRPVAPFLGSWAPPDSVDAQAPRADSESVSGRLAASASSPDARSSAAKRSKSATERSGEADDGRQARLEAEAAEPAEALPAHPLGFLPRPVAILESSMAKTMDVRVTMPGRVRLGNSRDSVWFPILDRLLQLMEGCRSVLVFVNSRRMAERLCLRLNDYTGQEMCRAHHGSMDRGRRLEVERLLKEGRLRCIVATSSLELGIDVGHVDLVVQLDSPLSAAAGIQRIGRAGHAVGEASRGVILARQRGSLPEIAVLGRMIAERDIDPIEVPRDALDVLSQQAVAVASLDTVPVERLYRLILGSDSYRTFPRQRLLDMLAVLAGLYPFARPLLEWDREKDAIGPRSNTRMAAVTGAGTIPQSGAYPVHHADSRSHVGELDEEFVQESRVGDVFQLGTSSWMISGISKDRVYVKETGNRFSEIPFWRNEAGSRSYRLGERVAQLWTELMERLEAADAAHGDTAIEGAASPASDAADVEGASPAAPSDEPEAPFSAAEEAVIRDLQEPYRLDDRAARSLVSLIRAQRATGVVPTASRLAVEVYKDIAGQTHIVIHNAWGRRVNRTWQLAIERKFETSLPHRLYGNAKDNGIEFVLPEWDPSWLQAVRSVTPDNLRELLVEALPGSPLLSVAFRRIAETSLLLKRSFGRTPMWQLRLRGEELLRAALPYADRFPYLNEAMRECLRDYLDEPRLRELLGRMQEGRIAMAVHYRDLPSPLASQFAADYVNMRIYEGDGLDRAVQAQLLQMSRELAGELFGQEALRGAVDPQVLAAERRRLETPAAGAPDSADELYRLLKQRGDLAEPELLAAVRAAARAEAAAGGDASQANADADGARPAASGGFGSGRSFGSAGKEVARESPDAAAAAEAAVEAAAGWLRQLREQRRVAVYEPGGGLAGRLVCADEAELYGRFPQEDDASSFVVERWIAGRLAFTPEELAARYPALDTNGAQLLISRLLEADRIQLAPFAEEDELLFTSALTAARVVRLSVQAARGRSEAADAVRWCRLLAGRQHALHGTQLQGEHGLLRVLEQLQGFFFPLSYWESFLLPSRLASYRPEELDLLCASGEVLWLGRKNEGEKEGKVAFFLPESRDLIASWLPADDAPPAHPQLLERLKRGGAMFLAPLARELGRQPSDVQAELLELVWQGHVSNDQFAPLRGPAPASRSRGSRTGRGAWGGSGLGRWFWTGSLRPEAESGSPRTAASTGRPERTAAAEPSAEMETGLTALLSGRSASSLLGASAAALAAGSFPQDGSPALRWIDRLLDVYGIVSRDLAAAMSPYAWDELLPVLKRLEEWGVLVRGQLIEGVPAMQFTTREIAESLRLPLPGEDDGLTVLSAADPANPFGLLADWPGEGEGGFARKPGNFLVLEDGEWRYWVESNGRRIRSLGPKGEARDEAPAAASLQQALASIASRQGLAKIAVEQWNGRPVDESPAADALRGIGAERDRHRFVLWKSQLNARR